MNQTDGSSITENPLITNVTGGLSLASRDGPFLLSLSSILKNVSDTQITSVRSCPTALPETDCEETPSYLCDFYDGCWISWGPCQRVLEGFYSPAGTTNQISCEPLKDDRRYVEGDATHVCVQVCARPGEYIIEGVCSPVPPGFRIVSECESAVQLVSCESVFGSIFTDGCQGRYLAVGLGPARSVSIPFTIQTWVRMNTHSLEPGSGIIPLFGFFGACFIGVAAGIDSVRLVLMISVQELSGMLASDPIPHLESAWVHVAVVLSDTTVSFFLNTKLVGNSTIALSARSSPFELASLLKDSVARQLEPYLNMEHFGPFRLLEGDVTSHSFWDAYVLKSFPDIELFDPVFELRSIKWCKLSMFSRHPNGTQVSILGNCGVGVEWNEVECECVSLPTFTPISPTPASTCTSIASTSQVTDGSTIVASENRSTSSTTPAVTTACVTNMLVARDDSYGSGIPIVVCFLVVTATVVGFLRYRRHARRIGSSKNQQRLEIYPLPRSDWVDLSVDWQTFFRN